MATAAAYGRSTVSRDQDSADRSQRVFLSHPELNRPRGALSKKKDVVIVIYILVVSIYALQKL